MNIKLLAVVLLVSLIMLYTIVLFMIVLPMTPLSMVVLFMIAQPMITLFTAVLFMIAPYMAAPFMVATMSSSHHQHAVQAGPSNHPCAAAIRFRRPNIQIQQNVSSITQTPVLLDRF